jgi:hypothetical protein
MNFDTIECVYDYSDVDTRKTLMKVEALKVFFGKKKERQLVIDSLIKKIHEKTDEVDMLRCEMWSSRKLVDTTGFQRCEITYRDGTIDFAYLNKGEIEDLIDDELINPTPHHVVIDGVCTRKILSYGDVDDFPEYCWECYFFDFTRAEKEMVKKNQAIRELKLKV